MRYLFYCDSVGRIGSIGLLLASTGDGGGVRSARLAEDPESVWLDGAGSAVSWDSQALAALAEFGGGLALIVGLLTRLASLGIISMMVVAIGMVHVPKGDPFVSQGGPSWELAAVYLACAVLFLLLGPGRFSLDALAFGTDRPEQR